MLDDVIISLEAQTDRFYGKYRGTVDEVDDPLEAGRIQARVPEVLGDVPTGWALPCAPYAGNGSGLYTVPPKGAPVWVEFEAGDTSRPIWSGGWWGRFEAPGAAGAPRPSPRRRELRSETGLTVALDDDGGTLTVGDGDGRNLLEIRAEAGEVRLTALTSVTIEAKTIKIGQQATEPAVLGSRLLSYLSQLVTAFNTHLHPGAFAGQLAVTPTPPGVPLTAPTSNLLSTKNTVE